MRYPLVSQGEPQPQRQQHTGDDEQNARPPERNATRTTAPAITPGSVPATNSRVRGFRSRPSRQNRNSPPGTAATLNNRFVGVTDGLGTCSTLSWIGSSSTAPDTPAGVATSASKNAHSAPTGHSHGIPAD